MILTRARHWIYTASGLALVTGTAAGLDTARAAPWATSPVATGLNIGLLTATFVAIIWYCWESRQMVVGIKRQSDALVFLEIQRQMQNVSRLWQSVTLFSGAWQTWTPAQVQEALALIDELERVAFLAVKALVDRQLVYGGYARVFTDSWPRLQSLVESRRALVGWERQTFFQQFASDCAEWREREGV